MAINVNWYVMDGKLGVNLNKVVTSVTVTSNPSQPEYPGIPHNLGDRVQGNNGSEWMFVQASATVTAFNMVQIGRGFKAQNLVYATAASLSALFVYGVAQFQLYGSASVGAAVGGVANAGDFFWALMKANGGARVNLSSSVSVAPGAALYMHATIPGFLTTSVTASNGIVEVVGIVPQASASGADTGVPGAMEVAMFTYPFPGGIVSVPAATV
jgi:hypothetical protein